MINYNVELLPEARSDLDDIFSYILLDNIEAAEKVLDDITSSLRQLEIFPHAGIKLGEQSLMHYEFRMIVAEPYVAFYRVIDNTVFVYRILHGARDYIQLLRRN